MPLQQWQNLSYNLDMRHQQKLSNLISALDGFKGPLLSDPVISGITLNSREVQPGFLFVAVSGGTTDGHQYIAESVRKGASVVIGEVPREALAPFDPAIPYLQVAESRFVLAQISAAFWGNPAHMLTMIGVTGTDGKTTTSNLIHQILLAANLQVGMISTVNAIIGDQTLDTGFHVTTPEAPSIQGYLDRMHQAGLTHVVLEATSHGLAQRRVASCEFDMGVITNITHEHLDYHGNFEAYQAAKGRLFEDVSVNYGKPHHPPRGAVLNRDDRSFSYLSNLVETPLLTYGKTNSADVSAQEISEETMGLRFTASGSDLDGLNFRLPIQSNLTGDFNIYNILAAVTLTRGVMRLNDDAVQSGVASLTMVPGRMERINLGQEFIAIVDFAHTPNALKSALEASRKLTSGRLIAVFGSAGLRDREKRRLMAETSAELADLTVLTAEDPRTESLAAILEEMALGARSRAGVEGKSFFRIPDRREALRFAVGQARPGDLLIACGKGHEQSMCFGDVEYLWDDRTALRAALSERLNIPGPEMPFLPDPS